MYLNNGIRGNSRLLKSIMRTGHQAREARGGGGCSSTTFFLRRAPLSDQEIVLKPMFCWLGRKKILKI